jgi:hypothetical protein
VNEWEKLRMFIDRQKADTVAARVVKLDEAARKEVAEALPGHLKVLGADANPGRVSTTTPRCFVPPGPEFFPGRPP